MTTSNKSCLCGGTFFTLLIQARKQRTSPRKKVLGNTDGLSDSDVLIGLIRIFDPNFLEPTKESFKTKTSEYKSCRTSSSTYLPFKDKTMIAEFDNEVINNYDQTLIRMDNFLQTFINCNRKGGWLVAALLQLIENDMSIDDSTSFYSDVETKPITKCELLKNDSISLQPFLLGIWHFILTKREDNLVGRETFENWHQKQSTPGASRVFISDIGASYDQKRSVSILDFSSNVVSNTNNDTFSMDIVPELTDTPPLLILQSKILPPTDKFSEYLQNAYCKYSKVKTLLYNDQPRDFYDLYVCNEIYQNIPVSKHTYRRKTIQKATSKTLEECSNFVIISGTGGLGKSMMMRHLLLDTIDNYDKFGRIPIFIPLKDYSSSYDSLIKYIFEKFESLRANISYEEFEVLLSSGNFLLLFDGLDEINSSYRKQFELDLELFADRYTKNMFVISSRPYGTFISFSRFTRLNLSPFSKEQSLELIDKLDFRADEPTIKSIFSAQLDQKLYYTHREFIQNPLLLTIMLMTFEQFAEVPSKMHIFYHEAYVALSQKHDASKGAYKRALHTRLTADKFSDYFSEFCARTYRDEKFEFSDLEIDKYYASLNEHKKNNSSAEASDFMYDLTANMCLMYYESHHYHFTHRSFQEYFCALYFSKQKDKTLKAIGELFENKRDRNFGDITFEMLYNMIPEKVEEYIFIPFLRDLFQECDENDGYWTFLEMMYPTICYDAGEVADNSYNSPQSFIYNFIVGQQMIYGDIDDLDFPFYKDLVQAEYVYLDENWRDEDGESPDGLINKEDVDYYYFDEYGDPETIGWNLEFEIESILKSPNEYKELIEFINSDLFPLKQSYQEVRDYYNQLIESENEKGDDLFDLF